MKAPAASIALVVPSGVALLVISLSTYEALRDSADAYYDRYRFGHVFANVKRASLHLEQRIKALDGVQTVALRVSKQAVLDIEAFPEPLMGRLVSIPEGRQPLLNQLVLRRGRLVEPGRSDEVVINESFAKEHGLKPGDTLAAIIDDSKAELCIVGIVMSPEFIYVIKPFALIPDKKRFGILWMGRKALEAADDYAGAFNELSLTVSLGIDTRRIVQALDTMLAPYGAVGAIDRKDHLSAWFVENELQQNQTSAQILPTIFLLVAAFLTSTVLARLIATERGEIGLMKAFGYSNVQVGWHYLKLVLAITALGILLWWGLGAMLGRLSTENYIQTLNFPLLIYQPGPGSFLIGAVASITVAMLATARAVRGAAQMPPIVAMNPPAPPSYQLGTLVPGRVADGLDESTRIVFRQIRRWPGRALITVLGFAGALAMMVLSLLFYDAIDEIAQAHFDEVQREDVALGFGNPQATTVLHEIERLPGVLLAEPMRIVPADLSVGHRRHRGTLHGLPEDASLARIYDSYIGMLAFLSLDELNVLLGDRPVTE